ncbi:MAG: hypothetical protein SGCHY_004507 [Lobulomycetales sp.]
MVLDKDILIDFGAGVLGGSAGIVAGHPLDTAKVRLQHAFTLSSGQPRNMVQTLTSIVRHEGPSGLYKGMASPLVGVAAMNALLFGVYGASLRFLSSARQATSHDTPAEPRILDVALAGTISGFASSFVASPIELVKIRLQNQRESRPVKSGSLPFYNGPLDCIRQIYRGQGVAGFTRGLSSTIIRETPSYGAYFASFELICRGLGINSGSGGGSEEMSSSAADGLGVLCAGGTAGIIAWIVTYPADVVKTRVQSVEHELNPKYATQRLSNAPLLLKRYPSFWRYIRGIAQTEGVQTLYRGLGAACVRAFPTNAAIFFTVAWSKEKMYTMFPDA